MAGTNTLVGIASWAAIDAAQESAEAQFSASIERRIEVPAARIQRWLANFCAARGAFATGAYRLRIEHGIGAPVLTLSIRRGGGRRAPIEIDDAAPTTGPCRVRLELRGRDEQRPLGPVGRWLARRFQRRAHNELQRLDGYVLRMAERFRRGQAVSARRSEPLSPAA